MGLFLDSLFCSTYVSITLPVPHNLDYYRLHNAVTHSPGFSQSDLAETTAACFSWGAKELKRPPKTLTRLICGGLLYSVSLGRLGEVPALSSGRPSPLGIMMKKLQFKMLQKEKQGKSPETDPNEMELYDLSDREL